MSNEVVQARCRAGRSPSVKFLTVAQTAKPKRLTILRSGNPQSYE